jgi:hypothetical protein
LEAIALGRREGARTTGLRLSGIDRNAEHSSAALPDSRRFRSARRERPTRGLGFQQRIVDGRHQESTQLSRDHFVFPRADRPREGDAALSFTTFSGCAWPLCRAEAVRDAINAARDATTTNVRLPILTTSTSPDLIKAHIDVFPTPIDSRAVFTEIANGPRGRIVGSPNRAVCSPTRSLGRAATADCSPRASTSRMRSASERAGSPLCPIPVASWVATNTGFCGGPEALGVPFFGDAAMFRCEIDKLVPQGDVFREGNGRIFGVWTFGRILLRNPNTNFLRY